jgi:hypothetical protein
MFQKSVLFALVLTLSSFVLAQSQSQPQVASDTPSPDSTTTCDVTFSSGTSTNATQFCVTVNGNVAQFSVAGGEMIAVGTVLEGYGVCDSTANVAYYDWAAFASGTWGSPTFTHSGNVVTVTRTTTDSLWQLKQTITHVPAAASGPGSAKVSMALKNLSGISRDAYIMRYADVDADNDQSGNDFDFTGQTVFGLEPSNRGLGSTNNTFNINFGQDTFAQNTPAPPSPCTPFTTYASHPFHGDGSIVQFWSMTVPHNATKTVVSTYKPI